MSDITLVDDHLKSGAGLVVSFQRTLRVPEDDRSHPLPPTRGRFPVRAVADFAHRLPTEWRGPHHFFLPMYQREALWLALDAPSWRPCVVKIGLGGFDAVSGEPWEPRLAAGDQDYLVCPPQLWVDGVNARSGEVRQFVATPLGRRGTIESQLRGVDKVGGIQLAVFEPRPGKFPDEPPDGGDDESELPQSGGELGVGAGGLIRQKIYADPHGLETWRESPSAEVFVHLLNSAEYRDVTGVDPPATPVEVQSYLDAGLPWFTMYHDDFDAVPPASAFDEVAGIGSGCDPEEQGSRPERGVQDPDS